MKNEFIPYILAGYPNLEATRELLLHCHHLGVRFIELGIPFSDPSADGPVIQNAAELASRTFHMKECIAMLKDIKKQGVSMEITIMSYANPIFAYGIDQLINDTKDTNVKGLLIPDLPIEEHRLITPLFKKTSHIKPVWMISENLNDDELAAITNKANYYLYLVSYIGTTGKNIDRYDHVKTMIHRAKKLKNIPIVVGFGLKSKNDVKQMLQISDGAIIGTRIVEELGKGIAPAKEFLSQII